MFLAFLKAFSELLSSARKGRQEMQTSVFSHFRCTNVTNTQQQQPTPRRARAARGGADGAARRASTPPAR